MGQKQICFTGVLFSKTMYVTVLSAFCQRLAFAGWWYSWNGSRYIGRLVHSQAVYWQLGHHVKWWWRQKDQASDPFDDTPGQKWQVVVTSSYHSYLIWVTKKISFSLVLEPLRGNQALSLDREALSGGFGRYCIFFLLSILVLRI